MVKGVRILVIVGGIAGAQRIGRRFHGFGGQCAARAAANVRGHGFTLKALVFLWQPAHKRILRGCAHCAGLRRPCPGE